MRCEFSVILISFNSYVLHYHSSQILFFQESLSFLLEFASLVCACLIPGIDVTPITAYITKKFLTTHKSVKTDFQAHDAIACNRELVVNLHKYAVRVAIATDYRILTYRRISDKLFRRHTILPCYYNFPSV